MKTAVYLAFVWGFTVPALASPSIEQQVVGSWGIPSVSGEVIRTFNRDGSYRTSVGGDVVHEGRWRLRGRTLVTAFGSPREEQRERVVVATIKRLRLRRGGTAMTWVRMRCPRCGTRLGSFATDRTMPDRRDACPACRLPLKEHPITATSNQAMQLTASKPDVHASSVCRRERMLRGMRSGLAAADLLAR